MASHHPQHDEAADAALHPDSKWQEPQGNDPSGLTLYEIHRSPRILNLEPNHHVQIPLKMLDDLRCPICSGFMVRTVLVRQCMHRFCQRCIGESRTKGNKNCPICNTYIPSQRHWSEDTLFDERVKSVIGNVEAFNAMEERQNEAFNASKRGSVTKKRVETRQRAKARKAPLKRDSSSSTSSVQEGPLVPVAEPIRNYKPSPLVNFLLLRHLSETKLGHLRKDDIRMSGEATLKVIQSFLGQKLGHEPASDIQILLETSQDKYVLLDTDLELGKVQREFGLLNDKMTLFYRLKN